MPGIPIPGVGWPYPIPPPVQAPASSPGVDISGKENQAFIAWSRLAHAWGHRLPVGMNKMTFYRARLVKVVR